MAEHDHGIGNAERARRLDIFEIAATQKLRTHEADQRDPGKQRQDAEQDEKAGRQHRGYDEEDVKLGNRIPDFDEALKTKIDPAAEIALHAPGSDPDD